jgi:hypothetical protein
MAITQHQVPAAYSSAHEPLFYLVSSDNTAQANFKFVFEVYDGATKLATVKQFPYPGTTKAAFDAHRIIQAYFNNLYFPGNSALLSGVTHDGNFQKTITVKYGEEYGSPVTAYLNLANSGDIIFYNYVNRFNALGTTNQLSGFQNKFITDNKTLYNKITDNIFVSYFNTSGIGLGFSVNKYNANGTQIGSPLTTTSTFNRFTQCNIGAAAINAYSANYIDSAVAYYSVYTGYDSITVYLNECFGYFTPVHLVFMNRLGGYDSFWFHGKSSTRVTNEKKSFGRTPYAISGTTVTRFDTGNVFRGNAQVHSVDFTYKQKLSSRFLNDSEFDYLSQLIHSPVVYIEKIESSTAYYVPVKITETNYDFKKAESDPLLPLEIDIEYSLDFNSQQA